MNREIKFRGKRNNGEWVYGYYVKTPKGECRIYLQPFEDASSNTYYDVIPETISEFTGLKDKNGKEIYEGDIVQHDLWEYPFEVIFNKEKARFVCKLKGGLSDYINSERLIVVGNIYENPELLKSEK